MEYVNIYKNDIQLDEEAELSLETNGQRTGRIRLDRQTRKIKLKVQKDMFTV